MIKTIAALMLTAAVAAPALAAPVTVVELYQSQGCSSCPPANANVNALAGRPDILALSFGVTYWNQLGWTDSFATPANTQRQWDYAKGLKHSQVWTPQVVINGRADNVGVRAPELAAAIAKAPPISGGPSLDLAGGSAKIGAGKAPAGGAEVWLVRYDPRTVQVAIKAGENGGRTLPHKNIVRQLASLGKWTGAPLAVKLPAAKDGLLTAVLVQARGGPILAAARA